MMKSTSDLTYRGATPLMPDLQDAVVFIGFNLVSVLLYRVLDARRALSGV
jgi:hypothetical protein